MLFGKDFQVTVRWKNRYGRDMKYSTGFEGVVPYIERKYIEAETDVQRQRVAAYLREIPCPVCDGKRLKPEVLAVTVNDTSHLGCLRAEPRRRPRVHGRAHAHRRARRKIAAQVLREIRLRLEFLIEVGLSYLDLARAAATLSGGEAQRIRLATQIGSGLTGVLYVLDEPSIGLHQRDNRRLIETLVKLKNLGNTLIVVEHDEDTIQTADWIVDIGPGAGEHGGRVVHSGSYEELLENPESITGDYLAGRRAIATPEAPPQGRPGAADHRAGREGQQPQERHGRVPARRLDGGHRRERLRQVEPRERHPVQGARERAQRRSPDPRQAHARHRSRRTRQGRARRPGADRPHPAIEPRDLHGRVRQDPHAVLRDGRREGTRLPARPLQLQRQGRPLRELLGRRHDQDRDELPARRLRRVRGLRGSALQPRHARREVQGQDHRRGARDADQRGRGVLRGDLEHPPLPEDARGGRARLRATRPERDDPLGRRGAARQARDRAAAPVDGPQRLRARRADHGPALRGRVASCSPCSTASSTRATP